MVSQFNLPFFLLDYSIDPMGPLGTPTKYVQHVSSSREPWYRPTLDYIDLDQLPKNILIDFDQLKIIVDVWHIDLDQPHIDIDQLQKSFYPSKTNGQLKSIL